MHAIRYDSLDIRLHSRSVHRHGKTIKDLESKGPLDTVYRAPEIATQKR